MQKQGGPGNKPRGDNRGPPRSNDDKRDSVARDRGENQGSEDRRRSVGGPGTSRYPDSHQVFVGNIPLDVHENEVRNVFSRFGTVVDIRIISSKTIPGKVFPKYGFVIFSDATAVHNCLSSKVI
jgi:Ras GTPase-activating protein-binding protein 1